jgi:geranylgeranyl pyrophosphate synthase
MKYNYRITNELELIENEMRMRTISSQKLLNDISRYIINAGGKRIRPVIMLFSYKAVGGKNIQDIIPLAAAFELIHTATLIHDDINDKSDTRRGKTAVHKKFGTRNALIAGDFLFAKAFEVGALYGKEVIKIASEASTKLAEGEVLQTKNLLNVSISLDTYHK